MTQQSIINGISLDEKKEQCEFLLNEYFFEYKKRLQKLTKITSYEPKVNYQELSCYLVSLVSGTRFKESSLGNRRQSLSDNSKIMVSYNSYDWMFKYNNTFGFTFLKDVPFFYLVSFFKYRSKSPLIVRIWRLSSKSEELQGIFNEHEKIINGLSDDLKITMKNGFKIVQPINDHHIARIFPINGFRPRGSMTNINLHSGEHAKLMLLACEDQYLGRMVVEVLNT